MRKKYLIAICIPTYNRVSDLSKNLILLEDQIISNNLCDSVYIVVSDNASSDNSVQVLENFHKRSKVYLEYYVQTQNIGARKNVRFVGQTSNAEYIMMLGDDDYLHNDYLKTVVNSIREEPEITCIVPDFIGVTPEGKKLFKRDPKGVNTLYEKGFQSCLENSWKAHQISGLTFKKDDVYEMLQDGGVNNMYEQIFVISLSCLRGKCWYLPEYPVSVTQTPQSKKYWSYGRDGLIPDNFDNYVHLGLNIWEVFKLEKVILQKSMFGIIGYPSLREIILCMFLILISKKTVWITRLYCVLSFYPYCFFVYFNYKIKNKIKKIIKWDTLQ